MRKGSALLIVLGMISFMLFSGIAFSVYMRQTRLPSTFLRRTTVTRQLAKAALAEAINDIDYAINDNAHPGVPEKDTTDKTGGNYKYRNLWMDRVFVGKKLSDEDWETADRKDDESDKDDEDSGFSPADVLVDQDDTVSTLTLEGLAYLPPCLINEVRYFSRHTPTARWQRFRFDAGRYAYCAIDVSDYFDVNRLLADRPRSSASSRRITFAHAFEEMESEKAGFHSKQVSGAAKAWDDWLAGADGIREVDPDTDAITFEEHMPLVSLADFNLLMAAKMNKSAKSVFGKIKNPFADYLASTGSSFYPLATSEENNQDAESYRSMSFVTDSLFRKTTEDEIDLENAANQPFDSGDMKESANVSLVQMQNRSNERAQITSYRQLLSRVGMATLFDYLDENSLPISLAMPTVERNPMICALNPEFQSVKFEVSKSTGDLLNGSGGKNLEIDATTRWVCQTVSYTINGKDFGTSLAGSPINGYALYPFLHDKEKDHGSYTLDGKLSVYLTLNGERFPMVNNDSSDRKLNKCFAFGDNDARDPVSEVTLDQTTGIISMPVSGTFGKQPKDINIKEAEDALIDFQAHASSKMSANLMKQLASWISVTYRWQQTLIPPPEGTKDDKAYRSKATSWTPQIGDDGVQVWGNVVGGGGGKEPAALEMKCNWCPVTNKRGMITAIDDLKTIYGYLSDSTVFNLNLALWLRIQRAGKGGSGTVDMVPACLYDDAAQGLLSEKVPSIERTPGLGKYFRSSEGFGRHIMSFSMKDSTGQSAGFSLKDLDGGEKKLVLSASPRKLMVADPRYNHNPNCWFSLDDGDDLKETWIDENKTGCNPYATRDGDFFMSVSDQGYLQSVYELGFLPRLTIPKDGGECDQVGENVTLSIDTSSTEFLEKGKCGQVKNYNLMWETYRVFGNEADKLYGPGFVSGMHGLKVNPYSDSYEILSAAFANTPADWSYASTNEDKNVAYDLKEGAYDFNAKCAWNAYSSGTTKLMWDDVQNIVDAYYKKVRTSPYNQGDWEQAFEKLNWNYNDKRRILDGAELKDDSSDVYSVDKKFLYGFWHDCFAANQQLFIVFIRAEPMMMGGGVAGNAPPQLSSRAVALVWRDPEGRKGGTKTGNTTDEESYMPHGLRVLFYHPLD